GTLTVANAITANGTGTVTLTATGSSSNITTSAAINSGSGLISLLADNKVTLNSGGSVGASTTGGIIIAADNDGSGAGTLTTSVAIGNASAAGAITLSGNDIALGASVTGSGALTIKPSTAARNITIGADNASDFALNPLEMSYLTAGFSSVTMGRSSDGTGIVTIYPVTVNNPTTVVGGSINMMRHTTLSFDGVGNSIGVNGVSSSLGSGNFSVSAWVKLNSVTNQMIFELGDDPSGNDAWLWFNGSGSPEFRALDGGAWQVATSASAGTAGVWAHVAGTFDATNGLKVYLDGALVG